MLKYKKFIFWINTKMQFENIEDNLKKFIDKYHTDKRFNSSFFIKLLDYIIESFKEQFEKITDNTDWDDLVFKVEYEIENKENKEAQELLQENYLNILKVITNGTKIIEKNGTSTFDAPKNIIDKIKLLPKEEQSTEMNRFFDIEPLIIKPRTDKPAIAIKFKPLIVDKDENTSFYRILLKFISGNSKPYRWKEEARNNFWKILNDHINSFDKESLTLFEINDTPIKTNRKVMKNIADNNRMIKASLHTELQKFGRKDAKNISSVMKMITENDEDFKNELDKYRIDVIGIDMTKSQNQSLFAIQNLLHENNYKGNTKPIEMKKETNSFKFMGNLPVIRFTPSKYLEAFGVSKKLSKREKMEYLANERTEALKALDELSQKKYLFHYKKKYWKDGKEVYDVVTTVRNLFNLTYKYEAVNKEEIALLKEEQFNHSLDKKLNFIELEPCPLLIDQIETYFVLKPANYYQEINLKLDRPNKQVVLFIDFLIAEVTKKEMAAKAKKEEIEWVIEINFETLAYKLRMEKMIQEKRVSRVKTYLEKCYESAKKLDYLLEYSTVKGTAKDIEKLVLNPEKFKRVKEINEELQKGEYSF